MVHAELIVTTKGGEYNSKTSINVTAENSFNYLDKFPEFVDGATYMDMYNKASLARNSSATPKYSATDMERTASGVNPYLYPDVNWQDVLFKNMSMRQRANVNISGGGSKVKYYMSLDVSHDSGLLNTGKAYSWNNNINIMNYTFQNNIAYKLTPTTTIKMNMNAQIRQKKSPNVSSEDLFKQILTTTPIEFPVTYPSQDGRIMYGNNIISGSTLYTNPYARMMTSFAETNENTLNTVIKIDQDLDFITKGLKINAFVNFKTWSSSYFDRSIAPYYYRIKSGSYDETDLENTNYELELLNSNGSDYISQSAIGKSSDQTFELQFNLNYARQFGLHNVGAMLLYKQREYRSDVLPNRNQGLSGRLTYDYGQRYLFEFNFGYNGSERFSSNKRWGFFPSIGGGWVVSNEKFFAPLKKVISDMKLRVSYGLIGNDQIGDVNDRFFYMSNVNLNDSNRGHSFGDNSPYTTKPGVSISRYANYKIGWEESRQLNVGLDVGLWDLTLMVDVYQQKRSNILLTRSYVPSTMGLQTNGSANVGKAETKGIDISLDYAKFFSNGFWTQVRGTFTFATSKITRYDEPAYAANEYYRSVVGQRIGQPYGYIAERLFIDDDEVANSPLQTFGEYEAGDIKYRDINGDGQITEADKVPIGHPTTPEINYGFGATMGYKGFDFSFYFQGSGRSSIFIDADACAPFIDRGNGLQSGLLKVIANDHWSEDNRNSYAFWPRLSDKTRANNNQTSTWWMRNGAFLRLKSIEIGYNLPDKVALKIGLKGLRVYANCFRSASSNFGIPKWAEVALATQYRELTISV